MRHVNGVEEKFKAALKLLFLEKKWSIQQKSIFMDCFRGLLRACVGIWERDIWNCLQFYDYRLSPHRTFTVAQHSFQFLEIHFNFISKSCLRKENENQSKQRIKKKNLIVKIVKQWIYILSFVSTSFCVIGIYTNKYRVFHEFIFRNFLISSNSVEEIFEISLRNILFCAESTNAFRLWEFQQFLVRRN